jgi:mannan endo-1,4-beta-mannosidase
MPQKLSIGSTGPDVILLQTRLNQRPSALPRLIVNGTFDEATLQRVLEFQSDTFVNGIFDSDDWARLLADPAPHDTFFTDGRLLRDPNGQVFVPRGIDLALLDDWQFPAQDRLADFAQSGANAVRIAWYITYPNPDRPAYSVADLDRFLTRCEANRLVAVVGLWDVTCRPDATLLNSLLVPWWTSDEVVTVLDRHKRSLVINLANELGSFHWADDRAAGLLQFKNAYFDALPRIREKLHVPVMIDAPDCGTSIDAWTAIAQDLIDQDPDHNVLFSAHAYWAAFDGTPYIDDLVNANLPVVFGEIANKQDNEADGATQFCFYDLDGLAQNHPPDTGFTYQALLQKLKAEEIGWFAWSWWPDGCLSRNIAIYNDVTNQFEGFRIPYGDDIVNNPDYGLKATAKPSSIFP